MGKAFFTVILPNSPRNTGDYHLKVAKSQGDYAGAVIISLHFDGDRSKRMNVIV